MMKVYLAGPITGLTYNDAAKGWRREFADMVETNCWPQGTDLSMRLVCYSPMRAKQFLADKGRLHFGDYNDHPLGTKSGIICRDHNDVSTCDLMIACFLEADGNLSLGTAIEFGWAHAYRKPIIMVAQEGDPHRNHPMLAHAAGYIVDNLEAAASLTRFILLPGEVG